MSLHDSPIFLKKGLTQRVTITATSAQTALWANIKGPGWVRVKAIGADVQCFFGESTDSVTLNSTTEGDSVGATVLDGHFEDFYLPGARHFDHFVWASAGSGYVELTKTDTKVKTAPSHDQA